MEHADKHPTKAHLPHHHARLALPADVLQLLLLLVVVPPHQARAGADCQSKAQVGDGLWGRQQAGERMAGEWVDQGGYSRRRGTKRMIGLQLIFPLACANREAGNLCSSRICMLYTTHPTRLRCCRGKGTPRCAGLLQPLRAAL